MKALLKIAFFLAALFAVFVLISVCYQKFPECFQKFFCCCGKTKNKIKILIKKKHDFEEAQEDEEDQEEKAE